MNRIKETLARITRAARGSKETSSSSSLRLDRVGRSSSSTLDSREREKVLVRADGRGPLILFDGTPNAEEGLDVVFVHGLFGSRSGTWTKGGICYPRDLLGHDIPGVRIIAWGWMGALSGNGTFIDQAESLLADIARLRSGISRPLIFIGHGLGGLVIKEALVTAAMSRIYGAHVELGNVYPRTIGCVFLGTPHVRSGKRSLGECIAATALLSPSAPTPQLLRAFKENDKAFENLHATFLMVSRDIRVVCIRERLPSTIATSSDPTDGMELGKSTVQTMVPRDSAAYEGFNVTRHDMGVSHLDLARFKSRDEVGYSQMLSWIMKASSGPTPAEAEAREPRNQEILNSIYYDTMNERESRIDPAYGQTCEWILNPNLSAVPRHFRSKDPVLWISGNAGSGKSTLMKCIARSETVRQQLLEGWASEGDLLMACFFMFEGGNRIQKSYEGFLRSVLYQILSARRDLIRIAFPSFFEGDWPPPVLFTSINNLNQAWYSIFAHMSDNLRLFILIDGIDEYRIMERKDHYEPDQLDITYDRDTGDEAWGQSKWAKDSHVEISKLINSMGNKDNVKFIVSSRELPIFEEAFAEYPRIRLQEHTEKSISQYVAGRLEDEAPGLPDTKNLCRELAQKSNGDILWARLAIDMVIGCSLRTLRPMLNSLPTHLGGPDGLYMRMLENLTLEQQQTASRIFHLVLSAQQPPSLITLSLAAEGYINPATGQLRAIEDNQHPYDNASLQLLTDHMTNLLETSCAGLLVAETGPSNNPNSLETGQRVVFVHQTAKEWVRRKDIWLKLPGCQPVASVEYYFKCLSGCVRHIKAFELNRPAVLAWPTWRFRPGAWLLIANALRFAEKVDKEVSDVDKYVDLLDELDSTCQRIWVAALQHHKPLHEDPDWYDHRLPSMCRKHWAGYEPMDAGKPPKRKDLLSLAVQANLIRYTATKLSRLDPEVRRKKAQDLLPYVVSPKAEGFSACAGLSGEYLDFHHDMPDSRILDVLFDAGASARDDDKVWTRALKTGRHYFSRGSVTMTHLLETSSSTRLMDNRERWVTAVKSLLQHGADPHSEIQVTTGSGESQSTTTVAAVDLIRETLEGEPEYAIELVEMEILMGRRGSVGIAR
ncbi:uncharacterized protein F4807DRAFT_450460 [Annulohypoxylon truncatum]|uniref:uncharacterized protein n=1 Tax=Annulohypoxylon truncatum TaxID=327061 RepID=UPI0020081FF0|nr:uncharacterized protein F4807DRAFT_450460 [Annulohypoxylon truncatum]KAI1212332.1 hypothetical protein F4807DRAFT_450460 [Annulohypoxylon truncatum]